MKNIEKANRFYTKHKKGIHVLLLLLAVAAGYSVLTRFGIGCISRDLFGICCPSCGMTRACAAALRGDFASAFYYHPLWVTVLPVAGLLIYFWFKKDMRGTTWVLVPLCVLLFAVYFLRLFFGDGEIVYINL